MSTNTKVSSVREMRESLIGKASEDLEFRARLTTDPRAAVHEALGVEIPGGSTSKYMRKAPIKRTSCFRRRQT